MKHLKKYNESNTYQFSKEIDQFLILLKDEFRNLEDEGYDITYEWEDITGLERYKKEMEIKLDTPIRMEINLPFFIKINIEQNSGKSFLIKKNNIEKLLAAYKKIEHLQKTSSIRFHFTDIHTSNIIRLFAFFGGF